MKHGKDLTFEDTAPVDTQPKMLRTIFCDGDERSLVTAAQQAVTQECQHPRQPRLKPGESFESHGLN